MNLQLVRNIGISAHIDSGKTTLSERILFYAGRIHRIQDVKGGGDGATMDHMELEKERGITITSACTQVQWEDHIVNLIDTPGHVDFTVEVERSLRVLDGAILVLCSVGGVQAQSMTVDRQMKRYRIPRLAFINKMDRTGADYKRVLSQVRDKLKLEAAMMQLPIGAGETFEGVIDLVTMKAYYFDGSNGENVREEPIPANLQADSEHYRSVMLETLSLFSDEMMELMLSEQPVPQDLIHTVTKAAVQNLQFTPVLVGSAYRNKGVQLLLDAVNRYLPNPTEREVKAKDYNEPDKAFPLSADFTKPAVGMAFKLVDDPFGQLSFMRIYQGTIKKGESYVNQRTGRKQRFSRLVRMHADKREEIDEAFAGDIIAVMGIDCASGDTYAGEDKYCTLESMFIPTPVIKMAIQPTTRDGADRLSKALNRFTREDPTFQVMTDEETGETLIAGMGELHLEIYVERIKREYRVECVVGAPKVSYREAPTQNCDWEYKHKKQTGGSGQYAHIVGSLEVLPDDSPEIFVFDDQVVGGRVPREYIPSVEKGFAASIYKGPLGEFPVVGVKMILKDGSYHDVDSSDMAFQICARYCFKEALLAAKPALLEPIMKMEIEVPTQFQGSVTGDINSRRGMVLNSEASGEICRIEAEVPLAKTFGYSTDIRGMTQGQGTFSMEFARYKRVPKNLEEEILDERRKEKQKQLVASK